MFSYYTDAVILTDMVENSYNVWQTGEDKL